MIDPEKVIKGLEICSAGEWNNTDGRDHTDCPYYPAGYTGCTCKLLMRDALTLLRERDAVKPNYSPYYQEWFCGNCGETIQRAYNFCNYCGRKVKWDA